MQAAWKAILAAALGGAATAASDALMFDGTTHPKQLAAKAAIGAAVAVAGYLKQSPIKPEAPPTGGQYPPPPRQAPPPPEK